MHIDEQLPPPAKGDTLALLEGVRVLDLTTSIAGPYCTLLLADLGASVVKIERPGRGDDARAWGPPFLDGESLWFLSVNRNKQSVALDYTQPAGLEALHELVRRADVVVVNQVAQSQKKLRIDGPTLRALNPKLIHVSITGFGMTGEAKDWPCYDIIAEGYSGVMDLTGEPDFKPQKVGTPAADLLSGSDASLAITAALFRRHMTGAGMDIDVSMVESMTRFMTPRIVTYLGSGELPRRSGGTDSVIAIYQTFDTADDPMTLGLGNDAIWQRFCKCTGLNELCNDDRYANNSGRREGRELIVDRIQELLLTMPRDHWLGIFSANRIPAGPINRLDQVVRDRNLLGRGMFFSAPRGETPVPHVALGIKFDGGGNTYRKAPPLLGEDNRQVLQSWLGWDDNKIEALAQQGVF